MFWKIHCEIHWKTTIAKKLPFCKNVAFFQQSFKHVQTVTSANHKFLEKTYGQLLYELSEAPIILLNSSSTIQLY